MIILIIISMLIFVDQISKYLVITKLYKNSLNIIPHLLNFTYVENRGALFGLGQSFTIFFIIANIIIVLALIFYMTKKRKLLSKSFTTVLILFISGGIGNLIDRITKGFVIDFLDISPIFDWPVFNIADIYVVIACILFSILLLVKKEKL